MPKLSHAYETEIRRTIRDTIALDPLISLKKIMELLNKKYEHNFHHQYLARLIKKVNVEATPNLDKEEVKNRLRKIRETMRIGQENLLQIAYGQGVPKPTPAERIAAWNAIGRLEKLQLDAELDLRIYDKGLPQGDSLSFRARPIPPEIREGMLVTAQLWRLPSDLTRKIEPGGARDVEYKESAAPPASAPASPVNAPIKANESPKSNIISPVAPDPELRLS